MGCVQVGIQGGRRPSLLLFDAVDARSWDQVRDVLNALSREGKLHAATRILPAANHKMLVVLPVSQATVSLPTESVMEELVRGILDELRKRTDVDLERQTMSNENIAVYDSQLRGRRRTT